MLYQYHCRKCGIQFDLRRSVAERNRKTYCPKCHKLAQRNMAPDEVSINSGKGGRIPGWNHSLDDKPVFIKSKKHMREECKKRNLYPAGLA